MNLSRRVSLTITAVSALLAASCRAPSDGTAETKASVATPTGVAEVHRGISGKEFINTPSAATRGPGYCLHEPHQPAAADMGRRRPGARAVAVATG